MFWAWVLFGIMVITGACLLYFNQDRFNERWRELSGGFWVKPEDDEPSQRRFVAYELSWPRPKWVD